MTSPSSFPSPGSGNQRQRWPADGVFGYGQPTSYRVWEPRRPKSSICGVPTETQRDRFRRCGLPNEPGMCTLHSNRPTIDRPPEPNRPTKVVADHPAKDVDDVSDVGWRTFVLKERRSRSRSERRRGLPHLLRGPTARRDRDVEGLPPWPTRRTVRVGCRPCQDSR